MVRLILPYSVQIEAYFPLPKGWLEQPEPEMTNPSAEPNPAPKEMLPVFFLPQKQ